MPFRTSTYSSCLITHKKGPKSRKHGAVCVADKKLTILHPNLESLPKNVIPVTNLKTKLTKWASNNVHGRYSEQLHKPGTLKEATNT